MTTPDAGDGLRLRSASGRWVLLASVLGSGLALLDATVVNVALPEVGRDLGAGLSGLQWTVNGYALTLASLILLGGSLGDRYGRRRVFVVGVAWFAVASLLCALAPSVEALVAARALQGVGGALLTPGSLALLSASFAPQDRGRAIGAWSGLGGVAGAVGPFLGGALLEVSWRLIFLINVPVAALVIAVALRHVPESLDPQAARRLDLLGAATGALGLGGLTYALTEAGGRGLGSPAVLVAAVVGVAGLAAFVVTERRSTHPLLPLGIFGSRQFTAANLVTFTVYAAIGSVFFLLTINLQVTSGFSPVLAGSALLPITGLLLALSAPMGGLAARIGPRLPMTVGPAVAAVGLLLMTRIGQDAGYLADVLPAVAVFGLGLAINVAPLTAAVLAAAERRHAGVASGVNNAVARAAGLLAVAVLPVAAGLSGDDYTDPAAFGGGFRTAMLLCAALLVAGSVLAFATIRDDVLATTAPAPSSSPAAGPAHDEQQCFSCPVDGPSLAHVPASEQRTGSP